MLDGRSTKVVWASFAAQKPHMPWYWGQCPLGTAGDQNQVFLGADTKGVPLMPIGVQTRDSAERRRMEKLVEAIVGPCNWNLAA
jgi:hypothetical protein